VRAEQPLGGLQFELRAIEAIERSRELDAETDGAQRGFGLLGMQERASLVGATLQIESAPGEGTTLFVRMPTSPVAAPTLAPDSYGVAREHA